MEGNLCHVSWIPSSWGTFGRNFGVVNGFLPSGGCLEGTLVILIVFHPIGGLVGETLAMLIGFYPSWGLHGDVN